MSRRISLAGRKTKHGSYIGYARGCRCVACKKAHALYQHDYYQRKENKITFKWVFAFNNLNTALALSLLQDK